METMLHYFSCEIEKLEEGEFYVRFNYYSFSYSFELTPCKTFHELVKSFDSSNSFRFDQTF